MTSFSAIQDVHAWSPAPNPSFTEWLEQALVSDPDPDEYDDEPLIDERDAHTDILERYFTTTQSSGDAARALLDLDVRDEIHVDMLILIAGGVPSVHGRLCALVNAVRAMSTATPSPEAADSPRWFRLMRELRDHEDGRRCTVTWRNSQAFTASYAVLSDERVLGGGTWRISQVVDGHISGLGNDQALNIDVQAACCWLVRAGRQIHEYLGEGKDGGLPQWERYRAFLQAKLDESAKDEEHRRTEQPRAQEKAEGPVLSAETLEVVRVTLEAMDAI